MIFQFDMEAESVARLSAALDNPISGFVYNPDSELPLADQKKMFMVKQVEQLCNSICFASEREVAIANEPNDSAAEQAKRFVGLTITSIEVV